MIDDHSLIETHGGEVRLYAGELGWYVEWRKVDREAATVRSCKMTASTLHEASRLVIDKINE